MNNEGSTDIEMIPSRMRIIETIACESCDILISSSITPASRVNIVEHGII